MSNGIEEDPIEALVNQEASTGVALSSTTGTSRLYPGFAMETPTTTAPASTGSATVAVDSEREPSLSDPVSSDLATVGQLRELKGLIDLDIRSAELRLTNTFEDLIFARLNEFFTERFESRFQATNDTFATLRNDIEELRKQWLARETSRNEARVSRPQITREEVGSASSRRPSTPHLERAATTRDVAPTPQLEADPRENEALRGVVTGLADIARQLQTETERLRNGQDTVQEPNDGFTTRPIGSHGDDPSPVGPQPEAAPTSSLHGENFEPLHTLQKPFESAVSYKTYRLSNPLRSILDRDAGKILKRAGTIRDAYSFIENFSGRQPVKLITFLKQLVVAFEDMDVYEGLAVRMISFFLEEDAHRFYTSLTSSAIRRQGPRVGITWPVLVHELLKRYCTEDVLAKAYEKVTRARQKDNEDEGQFHDRISAAALECGSVFDEHTLVSYYVSGLSPTIRYAIAEDILRYGRDIDLSIARRMALAAGETYRARLSAAKPTKTKSTPRAMVLTERSDATPTGSRAPILMMPPMRTAPSDTTSDTTEDHEELKEQRPILANLPTRGDTTTKQIPVMTDREVEIALKMMTRNKAAYRCWGCREHGHDLYNCPYLTYEQRSLFALANYNYQAETRGSTVADSHLGIQTSNRNTRSVSFAASPS